VPLKAYLVLIRLPEILWSNACHMLEIAKAYPRHRSKTSKEIAMVHAYLTDLSY